MNIRPIKLRFVMEVVKSLLVKDVEACPGVNDKFCVGTVNLEDCSW